MRIVNLTERSYREYVHKNNLSNFGQATEYSRIITNRNKRKLFLGLLDDSDNIIAATQILITNKTNLIKEAVAPNGYIIDYNDYELVKIFTNLLKERLLKEGVTYLITNPMFKYKEYNKYNIPILNNEDSYNNLISLGYISLGYYSEFENYDIIIENNNSLIDIYNNFNRNTKRCINDALKLGITIHKGSINDIDKFYELVKKKNNHKLAFYESIMKTYHNEDNLAEIFFTKINPNDYLIRVKAIYEKIKIDNERINRKFRLAYKVTNRLLNRKMNSDRTLDKYKNILNKAIELNTLYDKDIIIGTSMIIRNNHEIYFLVDGYNEEYRYIHSTSLLKWAIIRKYYNLGYRIFNLGEIYNNYLDRTSKYYNQYKYKIGFGGNIVEYTPNLLYVINKPMFKIYQKLNHKKH